MECSHLSIDPNGKTCRLMVKQGLDGELDDFDIKHYCKGNPNHCYFYRSCKVKNPVNQQLEENKPEKIQVAFYEELSKLKLGEVEVSVDRDEPHPFDFELIKRGFRHKVKPMLGDNWVITAAKVK